MRRVSALALIAAVIVGVACAPIEPDATVELTDHSIALDRSLVPAGHRVLAIHNGGTVAHELVVVRSDSDADKLPYDEDVGQVTVRGGPVAEREHIAVGATKRLSVDLAAGRYVLICNQPGHYAMGMRLPMEAR